MSAKKHGPIVPSESSRRFDSQQRNPRTDFPNPGLTKDRLRKLNRTYALVSAVNRAIVRQPEQQALFDTVCQSAVEDGGFLMAWIGILDPQTKQVKPVAHAGKTNGYLESVKIKLDDSEQAGRPTATALRTGEHVVVNDIANDARMSSWRSDALRLGCRAYAAFPLIVASEVRGTLNLYAPEAHFFDDDALELLDEMAGDINFALELIEQEGKSRQAEKALQEKERLTAAIVNTTPALIYVYDMETRCNVYSNAGIEQLLGISSKDIQAMDADLFAILIHPDDLPHVAEFQSRMMAATDAEILEIEYRMKDQEGKWHTLHGYERPFVRNTDGSLKQKLGVAIDITERKQAEESLQESEEKFSSAFSSSPVALGIASLDGIFLEVNHAFCDLVGYSHEEIVGKTVIELGLMSATDRENIATGIEKEGGSVRNTELRFRVRDGSTRDILYSLETISLKGVPHRLAIGIDITARKRTEVELRKWETIFRHAGWGVVIVNAADNTIMAANPAFAKMYGYSESELIGKYLAELFAPQTRGDVPEYARRATEEDIYSYESIHQRKDGTTFPIQVEVTAFKETDGKVLFRAANVRDITERKQAEMALTQYAERLEQAEKHAQLGSWEFDVMTGQGWWSKQMFRMLGFEISEQAPSFDEYLQHIHPEDRFIIQETLVKMTQGELPLPREFRSNPEFGPMRIFAPTVYCEKDERGVPIKFSGTLLDITDRKRAEQALQRTNYLLQLLVEHAPAAIAMFDMQLNYLAVSRRFLEDYQLGNQDIIGKSHYEVFPEIPDRWKEIHRRCLAGAVEQSEEDPFPRSDGRIDWIRWEIRPWYESSGMIGGIILFSEVITEGKRAESALRESEERYRNLLEVAPVGIAVHAEGRLVFANPAGAHMLGAESEDQIVGRSIQDIIHPDSLKTAQARIQRMLAGEPGLYPVEDTYRRLDGRPIQVEVMATALAYQGKPAVQIIVNDITERKLAEEELRLHRDRLVQLSRRLVNAHETEQRALGRELHDQIGQMLTALRLTLEIVPQLQAEQSAEKLAGAQELVNDLLNRISRISLELRPPMLDDLGLIPALLWHINRNQEQTGIEVDFKHSGVEGQRFTPEIETAAYRIIQEALTNVARHAHGKLVNLQIHVRGKSMDITIKDDGQGFDPHIALVKRDSSGLRGMRERTGLLDGNFRIESQSGKGTRISIKLPLQEGIA